MTNQKHYITHVAIIQGDKIYSLQNPNRHHHVNQAIFEETGAYPIRGCQGFLDNFGDFHDRGSALLVARAANQLLERATYPNERLYSEDVW